MYPHMQKEMFIYKKEERGRRKGEGGREREGEREDT